MGIEVLGGASQGFDWGSFFSGAKDFTMNNAGSLMKGGAGLYQAYSGHELMSEQMKALKQNRLMNKEAWDFEKQARERRRKLHF